MAVFCGALHIDARGGRFVGGDAVITENLQPPGRVSAADPGEVAEQVPRVAGPVACCIHDEVGGEHLARMSIIDSTASSMRPFASTASAIRLTLRKRSRSRPVTFSR